MNPVEQIAAVLARHQEPESYEDLCGCGFDFSPDDAPAWSAHVADAVVEALGLTEELGYTLEGEHPEEPDAWFPASSYNTSRPVTHTRWVSGWSVVGGEPT